MLPRCFVVVVFVKFLKNFCVYARVCNMDGYRRQQIP